MGQGEVEALPARTLGAQDLAGGMFVQEAGEARRATALVRR